jgi:serine protease Do
MKKALALLLLVAVSFACFSKGRPPPSAKIYAPALPADQRDRIVTADFVRVARKAMPAVVHVYTLRENPRPSLITLLLARLTFSQAVDLWVRGLFTTTYSTIGAGSGFLINKRGYILTNNHVVADADKIVVKIADYAEGGEEADKLGSDPLSDVAMIKIKGDYRHAFLRLGDSDRAEVGEWVGAIGNPFDVGESFTRGVVSGVRRDDIGMLELEDFIQTDASINPGNSGGPLINERGEVIGINSIIFSDAINIGLAVPINIAKKILPKLVNGERIDRGMLGVSLADVPPELAARLGVPDGAGALVTNVRDDSAANKAGIRPGDVIVAFNDKKVCDFHELKTAAVSMMAGATVTVNLVRNGKFMAVRVKLSKFERKT